MTLRPEGLIVGYCGAPAELQIPSTSLSFPLHLNFSHPSDIEPPTGRPNTSSKTQPPLNQPQPATSHSFTANHGFCPSQGRELDSCCRRRRTRPHGATPATCRRDHRSQNPPCRCPSTFGFTRRLPGPTELPFSSSTIVGFSVHLREEYFRHELPYSHDAEEA
jgi:hypothetical protein